MFHRDFHPALRALTAFFLLQTVLNRAEAYSQSAGEPKQARAPGMVQAQLAAGTTNGARFAIRLSLPGGFAPEVSAGYLRLSAESVSGNLSSLKVSAFAAGAGVNWFSHPDNSVAPMFSLLFTYTQALERISSYVHQKRFSITCTGGSEFDVLPCLALHFRLGPSVTFLSKDERGATQLYMHFDAGVGWTF